ncbi:MAG: amino acid ABC transporter substrate-binding protein [Bacillota bacterium]
MNKIARRDVLKAAALAGMSVLVPGSRRLRAQTGAPVRIGCTLPLTGPFADTGTWVQRGYEYWAEEVNARGGLLGRPVELRVLDDASSVERATSLLERLISVDRVDLILGGYPGTSAAAQMLVAERYRKVYISMGGHMASFSRGFKYSFGAPPLMGEWWYTGVWKWLATMNPAERPQRAAAITLNNAIGQAVRKNMVDGLKSLGIPLVVDELYTLPLASAEPLVQKAKGAGADLFIANGFFGEGVQTVRAMKALDYNPKLFLQGIGSIIPEWVKELGPDGDYVVSGTPLHHKLPYPGLSRLVDVVKARFTLDEPPQYFLFGYAWAQALEKAVEGSKSLGDDDLASYLRLHPIDTIAGRLKFGETGLPEPYEYTTQVINGKVELIWPLFARTADPVYPRPPWRR